MCIKPNVMRQCWDAAASVRRVFSSVIAHKVRRRLGGCQAARATAGPGAILTARPPRSASRASRLSCRLVCFSRWSDLTNGRWQTVQTNLRSPVWARLCRESSSLRANILSQFGKGQLKGFSPVCTLNTLVIQKTLFDNRDRKSPVVSLEVGEFEVWLGAAGVGAAKGLLTLGVQLRDGGRHHQQLADHLQHRTQSWRHWPGRHTPHSPAGRPPERLLCSSLEEWLGGAAEPVRGPESLSAPPRPRGPCSCTARRSPAVVCRQTVRGLACRLGRLAGSRRATAAPP